MARKYFISSAAIIVGACAFGATAATTSVLTGVMPLIITAAFSTILGGVVTYFVNGPKNRNTNAQTIQTEIETQLNAMKSLIHMKNNEVGEYTAQLTRLAARVALLEKSEEELTTKLDLVLAENAQLRAIIIRDHPGCELGELGLIFHQTGPHAGDEPT